MIAGQKGEKDSKPKYDDGPFIIIQLAQLF